MFTGRRGRGGFFAWVFISSLGLASIQAQGTSAIDRAQITRQQAPTVVPQNGNGFSTTDPYASGYSLPNESDIGEQRILKRQAEYLPFTFTAGIPIYYTSNVALVREGEESDVLYVPQVALTYQPQLTKTLFAEATVQQQQFYYDEFSDLDFGSFDIGGGLLYVMPEFNNLALRARYNFNRLTDSDFDEFFANHTIFLSAELPFSLAQNQQLSVGASGNISIYAEPDDPQRSDYDAYIGYTYSFTPAFFINASGRISVRDYYEGGRTDVSEILSLVATWRITPWAALSAISSFAWNQSNQDVFEYHVTNAGGAVALTLRF